jgi:hypothetical protein
VRRRIALRWRIRTRARRGHHALEQTLGAGAEALAEPQLLDDLRHDAARALRRDARHRRVARQIRDAALDALALAKDQRELV